MTSERSCYVYLTLPGETSAVTAGRFTHLDDRFAPLGRFLYGKRYLERPDAVPLDPVELKLQEGTFEKSALGGMFGALRDASPDWWGRLVINRHAGVLGLGELDYLLQSPDDRAGALGFGLNIVPPAPLRSFNRTLDLAKLQAIADDIIADRAPAGADAEQARELLLRVSTSMGGARPKAVVEDDDALWLAKLNANDKSNLARIEHAMLLLARACGINAAFSRIVSIGDRDVLLVKRFDRERAADGGYRRARMISALTLLRAEDSAQARDAWSYPQLVEELRLASAQPKRDAHELFRRMVFNALISNTDDQPRNHALIAPGREWQLSPAYDLTPSPATSVERRDLALVVGDDGRWANARNCLSQCRRFLLERDEAAAIVDDMEARVRAEWYPTARAAGVSERDCERIRGAFAYDGFRFPISDD